MRHHHSLKKLGRDTSHRRAMLRSLATSLLKHESCQTTVTRAKELRRVVEPLISSARRDSLAARRAAYSYLMDKGVVHKLFADIGPRFSARNGGYTRVLRTGFRHGDAAQMAVIQLVERTMAAAPKSEKKASTVEKSPRKPKTSAKAAEGKKSRPSRKKSV